MTEHANGSADEDAARDGESLLEALPAIIAVATLGIGATTAILGLGQVTAIVFVVGWLLLTPLSAIVGELSFVRNIISGSASAPESSTASADSEADAALAELKRRYARGEIDEAEFERRTELLLENESLDDVQSRVERGHSHPTDPTGERVDAPAGTTDADRNREREYET